MNCITTMVSGWYSAFIPMFEYTAHKFNPGCDVRVFRKDLMYPDHNNNTVNLLRFCIPKANFDGYEYVFFTDVDFIFLPHDKSTVQYHVDILEKDGLEYLGHRGPIKNGKWDGEYARMAGGAFLASQKWLEKTEQLRYEYANKYINGVPTREHDEIYLNRICVKAGYETPKASGHFNGSAGALYDNTYRNLHLGDFKPEFKRRWTNTDRMKVRFLNYENYKAYKKLTTEDNNFVELIYEARKTPEINKIFQNLNNHLERRK